jgi:hypothetical protein
MIWVTHDLLPYDPGEPGGEVEMTRMLCFEFEDGSGGSEWPVDEAWQPPGAASGTDGGGAANLPIGAAVVGLIVLVLAGASWVAFRRRSLS